MLAGVLVGSILAMAKVPWSELSLPSSVLMPSLLTFVSWIPFLVHHPHCHLCHHFLPLLGALEVLLLEDHLGNLHLERDYAGTFDVGVGVVIDHLVLGYVMHNPLMVPPLLDGIGRW